VGVTTNDILCHLSGDEVRPRPNESASAPARVACRLLTCWLAFIRSRSHTIPGTAWRVWRPISCSNRVSSPFSRHRQMGKRRYVLCWPFLHGGCPPRSKPSLLPGISPLSLLAKRCHDSSLITHPSFLSLNHSWIFVMPIIGACPSRLMVRYSIFPLLSIS